MKKIFLLLSLLPFIAQAQAVYSFQTWVDGGSFGKRIVLPHDSTSHSGDIIYMNGLLLGLGLDGKYHTIGTGAPQVQTDWNATSGLGQILHKPSFAAIAFSGSWVDITDPPNSLAGYGIGDAVNTGLTYNKPSWLIGVDWSIVSGFKADSTAAGFHTPGFYDARYSGGGSAIDTFSLSRRIDQKPRVFNVLFYDSLAGSGLEVFDGIANGSNQFQVVSARFTAADIGKVIKIDSGLTSNLDLVTTISAVTNSTTITLAAAATKTKSALHFEYGKDATPAIQAAINDCYAKGGGKVWLPVGMYMLNGALQTSVGGVNPNCQLYITSPASSRDTARTSIIVEGEAGPVYIGNDIINDVTYWPGKKGTVLVSCIDGSGTGAAVFGAKGPNTSFSNFSYITAVFKNLTILTRINPAGAGPSVGGINFSSGTNLLVDQVLVSVDGIIFNEPQPTNDVCGIATPALFDETMNVITNSAVLGYTYGYVVGEHTELNQVQADACWAGFNFPQNEHATHGGRIETQWCSRDIVDITACGQTAGSTIFNINHLDVETSLPDGHWYNHVYVVDDATDNMTGYLGYHTVTGGSGASDMDFARNGADFVTAVRAISPFQDPIRFGDLGIPTSQVEIRRDHNAATALKLTNTDAGNDAQANFRFDNGTDIFQGGIFGTGKDPDGNIGAGDSYNYTNSDHLVTMVDNAAGRYSIAIGATPGEVYGFTKDSAALTNRFSYTHNLGSSFTDFSLIDKHYGDSAIKHKIDSIAALIGGGGGSPGGPFHSIQVNSGGSFYGDGFFTRNESTGVLDMAGSADDMFNLEGSSATRVTMNIQATDPGSQATLYLKNDRGGVLAYGGPLMGGSTNSNLLFGLSRADRFFLIHDGTNGQGMGIGTLNATDLVFGTNNIEVGRFSSAGALKLNTYGIGSHTGTAAFNLSADASGNVIETAIGPTQTALDDTAAAIRGDFPNPKLFAATADGSVNNTSTPTSLIGTGVGSMTIAANKLVVGSVISFKGRGTINTALTAPTMSFNFKIGSSGNAASPTIGVSLNGGYEFEMTAIVRTSGSGGTVMITGWVDIAGVKTYLPPGSFALNTTTTELVDLVLTMGGTVGSGDTVTTKASTLIVE